MVLNAQTTEHVVPSHSKQKSADRAFGWVEHMASLGWEALHNRHLVVERGGDRLVVAGVDDRTAAGSGVRNGRGGSRVSARRALTNRTPVVTNGSHGGRAMTLFTMRIFIGPTKARRVRRME